MISIEDKILKRIRGKRCGWVMTNRDFWDLSNPSTVDWSLFQLKQKGLIQPLLRGIYYYPQESALLQEVLAPDLYKVAQAIARKHQWRIQISGDAALNFLGLSTQVPMALTFYSDGPSRTYDIGGRQLHFKRMSLKESKLSTPMCECVVQALRHLGEANVSEEVVERLQKKFSREEKKVLWQGTRIVRTWIRKVIERICQAEV